MNKLIAIAITLLSITACNTVKYNYVPETSSFSIPELHTKVSAGLGEPLLDQGLAAKRDILKITKESEISAYDIKPGKLIKVGQDDKAEYYNQDLLAGYTIYSGLFTSTPDMTATIQYKKDKNEYCIMRPADITVCGDLHAVRDSETVMSKDSFRRTLIYSGRVGNKLKISYREFNNDLARAAFSTEVEYDLGESNIIGYAGARLEVIKATNTEIEYIVLKNFNSN